MSTATIDMPGPVGKVKKEYLYVGGASAGILAVIWIRRSRDTGAATDAAAVDPTAAAGDLAAGVDAYANPAGGSTVIGNPATDVDPDTLPATTNTAWTTRVISRLSDVGWDPMAVTQALGRYLTHTALADATQVEIIRAATAVEGPPPQGTYSIIMPTAPTKPSGSTPATPTPPKPAPKPVPKPAPKPAPAAHWKTITIPKGATLSGLASKYHTTVKVLAAENHIANVNRISAGAKLRVPA